VKRRLNIFSWTVFIFVLFFSSSAVFPQEEVEKAVSLEDFAKLFKEKSGEVFLEEIPGASETQPLISIQTGASGSIRICFPDGNEIRTKENTKLIWHPRRIKILIGLLGVYNRSGSPMTIETPDARIFCNEGLFVAKVYTRMTRIAALKGDVTIQDARGNQRAVSRYYELAVCSQEISERYRVLEDLEFAWYWEKK